MAALRALFRVHAAAFSATAVPVLVGVMLVAAVVLGKNGLDPRDVVRAMHHDPITHATILAAWIAIARAPTQAQLLPPGATWTRSAPIALPTQLGATFVFAAAVQAPLTAMIGRGGGAADAIGATLLAIALAALPAHRLAALTAVPAVAARLSNAPASIALPLSAIACAISLAIAHRDAPLRARRTWRVRVRLPVVVTLALAHVRVLVRAEGPRVTRTILLGLLIAGFVVMQVRGDAGADLASRAIVTAAATSMIGLGTLARAIGRTRRRLAPLVRATGASSRGPFAAAAVVLAAPSFAILLTFAALLRRFCSIPLGRALAVAMLGGVVALALSAVGARLEDRLAARRRDDATRWVLVSLGLGVVGALAALVPSSLRALLGVVASVAIVAAVWAPDAEVPHARA